MITKSISPDPSIKSASLKVFAAGLILSAAAIRSGLVSQTAAMSKPSAAATARLCSSPMAPYASKPTLTSALVLIESWIF
jgi:hypothetical protein